jgi:hypothetical protein
LFQALSEEWDSALFLAPPPAPQAGEWVQGLVLVLALEQAEELGRVQVLGLLLALVSVRDWVRVMDLALYWEFVALE